MQLGPQDTNSKSIIFLFYIKLLKNIFKTHVIVWMNVEDMLSETRQTEKNILYLQ
jgi:hypothetical protein